MALKKRADGRYCKQIRINGKVKSFYGRTQAEINKKIIEYKEEKATGKYFSDVAEKWVNYYCTQVPYTTYKKCGQAAYNAAVEHFGNMRIREIVPYDVDLYLKSFAHKDYSKKTVATYKSILNQIFKYAVIQGEIQTNPASVVSLPKNLKTTKRVLPPDNEIKIIELNPEGFGFLPYFLLFSGLRISEALALTYEDIDRKDKIITVNKKIVYDGNTPTLVNATKTEAGTRKVVLLDRVEAHLNSDGKGVIFCNDSGGYLTRKQLSCRWEKFKKENNLTLTFHQLRHAYATMLFEAGINEKDAQELMGHTDINLTRSIYTHIRNERMTETAQKLNSFNF